MSTPAIATVLEQHFSVSEIAKRLSLSVQTITRIFQDEPGVMKLRRGLGRKRDHVVLRISESVVRRVIDQRSR